MYIEAAVVTAMGIAALTVLRRFEDKNVLRQRVAIVLGADTPVDTLIRAIQHIGAAAQQVEYDRHLDDAKRKVTVTLDVQLPETIPLVKLIAAIETVSGVRRVHVQHSS